MNRKKLVQLTRMPKSDYYETITNLKSRLEKHLVAPQIPPEKLTKKVAENVLTSKETPIPDCLTCGVCCVYALSVPVSNCDPTPPENYWEIMLEDSASEIVVNKMLKRTDTKCDYLGGETAKNVACRIYEVRPDPCRTFEAGSDRCHAYRRLFALEPPLNDDELSIANEKLRKNPFDQKITFVMITEKEVTTRTVITAEGFSSERKTSLLQITAFIGDDETPHIIHNFDPEEETWLEDDFLTYTISQAKDLIEQSQKKI